MGTYDRLRSLLRVTVPLSSWVQTSTNVISPKNEWMTDYNAFLQYIYIYIGWNSVRVWKRQEDRGHRHRLAEVYYIEPFKTHIGISYSGPHLTLLLLLRQGGHCSLPQVAPNTASALPWLMLQLADRDTNTNCVTWVPMYI